MTSTLARGLKEEGCMAVLLNINSSVRESRVYENHLGIVGTYYFTLNI